MTILVRKVKDYRTLETINNKKKYRLSNQKT